MKRVPALKIAASLAICIVTLGSAFAQAATQSPVTINSCQPIIPPPNPMNTAGPSFMGIPLGTVAQTSSGMAITFVNDSNVTAKLVNFAVNSNGSHFVIRDVGTFSPGVTIVHRYSNGRGQGFILPAFIAPNVTCHVASVEFTDGSTWRRGEQVAPVQPVPPPPAGGMTATPPHVALDQRTESALCFVQSPARVASFKEIDNCTGIASVNVGAAGDNSASYTVRPLGPGSCTAHVINENGSTVAVPITVH